MENYNICNSFYYVHKAGDIVVPHTHECYELILYENGSGEITIGDESAHYYGQALHLVAPNTVHCDCSDTQTKVYCCLFYPSVDWDYGSVLIRQTDSNSALLQILQNKFEYMTALFETDKNLHSEEIDKSFGQMLYILQNLIALQIAGRNEYKKSIVENAKKFIRINFNKTINFNILSESIGYSYDRFRHIFTATEGMPPKQYQNNVRLVYAKSRLSETRLKVKDIAQKTGFSSDIRFYIWFKTNTGLTPTAYRKMILRGDPGDVLNVNTK